MAKKNLSSINGRSFSHGVMNCIQQNHAKGYTDFQSTSPLNAPKKKGP